MNKFIEFETRFINLDTQEILEKLEKIKAQKNGEFLFKEWLFYHDEWKKDHRRIRVRTDGTTTWLTYKSSDTWSVDSTKEIEVEVSSSENIIALLKAANIPLRRHQEKKIIRYTLNDIHFEINFWPKIPMVLEIESTSEKKVREGVQLLGLDWDKAIFEDQLIVHKKYYGIDLHKITDNTFG